MGYEIFAVGDMVRLDPETYPGNPRILGMMFNCPYVVTEVKDVPSHLINYDPVTQSGGVGHCQWVFINVPGVGVSTMISGKLLVKVKSWSLNR